MDIDPPNPRQPDVIDDEELQVAMSRMRREAGKLRRKHHQTEQKPADKPDQDEDMIEERSALPAEKERGEQEEEEIEDGRLVIDDASEFIRTISLQQERLAELRRKEEVERNKPKPVSIEPSLGAIAESETDSVIDEEAERREMERLMAGDSEKVLKEDRPEVGEVKEVDDESTSYGATGSEQYVSGGMASTLSLLKSQGLIKPMTPEEREKERLYKEKMAWLIEQRRREAERELEKEKTKKMGDAKDQATREYENRMREAAAAKDAMEAYRHYKPDVEIKYNDEFGRELSRKEAWKALSHKFHGKGSGKAKTEKRIKKIEEEKKLVSYYSSIIFTDSFLSLLIGLLISFTFWLFDFLFVGSDGIRRHAYGNKRSVPKATRETRDGDDDLISGEQRLCAASRGVPILPSEADNRDKQRRRRQKDERRSRGERRDRSECDQSGSQQTYDLFWSGSYERIGQSYPFGHRLFFFFHGRVPHAIWVHGSAKGRLQAHLGNSPFFEPQIKSFFFVIFCA
jgi:hypothetical protein